jgi:hypothetical protein
LLGNGLIVELAPAVRNQVFEYVVVVRIQRVGTDVVENELAEHVRVEGEALSHEAQAHGLFGLVEPRQHEPRKDFGRDVLVAAQPVHDRGEGGEANAGGCAPPLVRFPLDDHQLFEVQIVL